MNGLSDRELQNVRRETENNRVDLRLWSRRLLAISEELTTIAAELGGRPGDRGNDANGGGHRPGAEPRQPGR